MNQENRSAAESANANALTAVAIAVGALTREEAKAEGIYTVTCLEVVPERKAEYDVMFQRFLKATQRGALARAAERIGLLQSAREIEEQLHAFPMREVWAEPAHNVVCTVGKNLALDTFIAGSSYTATGPYMGLISSVSWSAVAAGDTMASHSGWTEAGSTNAPTFSARGTPAWSSASAGAKATSSAVSFTMTGAGTLKGCFLVYGSGAVTTLMNTSGTILSAGAFTGGDQAVSSGNVVTVTYYLSM
jgi:hypothetical protein